MNQQDLINIGRSLKEREVLDIISEIDPKQTKTTQKIVAEIIKRSLWRNDLQKYSIKP